MKISKWDEQYLVKTFQSSRKITKEKTISFLDSHCLIQLCTPPFDTHSETTNTIIHMGMTGFCGFRTCHRDELIPHRRNPWESSVAFSVNSVIHVGLLHCPDQYAI